MNKKKIVIGLTIVLTGVSFILFLFCGRFMSDEFSSNVEALASGEEGETVICAYQPNCACAYIYEDGTYDIVQEHRPI